MEPRKLFNQNQVAAAGVFGGPLPAGILFYLNYKRLGKEKEAYIAMAIALLFTVALFFTLSQIPASILDKIPDAVFTGFYGVLIALAFHYLLNKEINQCLAAGDVKASNWTVAGVIVIGLVASLVIIFTLTYSQPLFEGEKMSFGNLKHEIYYNPEETSAQDVTKLANELTSDGFFGDENQVTLRFDTSKTQYIITLPIDQTYWEDPELLAYFNDLKSRLLEIYQKEVIITFNHYELSGKIKQKSL